MMPPSPPPKKKVFRNDTFKPQRLMPSESTKKLLIVLMLGLLTISAFFMRLENFKNSQARSIDEIVYSRMAKQIIHQGLSGYNSIPYGRELAETGRVLPQYFFEPLFKHPPLFTLLIAFSMKLFGPVLISAEYVSLLFAILTIPLTYFFGSLLFNRTVGMLTAFLLWADPVSVICSQKVWMESLLSFFTILSIYLFAYAGQRRKDIFFLFAGISAGLAALTKYPGFLALIIILSYALCCERRLFKNKMFITSLLIPFLIFLPWLFWNLAVYRNKLLTIQGTLHHDAARVAQELSNPMIWLIGVIMLAGAAMIHLYQRKQAPKSGRIPGSNDEKCYTFLVGGLGILLCFFLWQKILNGLNIYFVPKVSWAAGAFVHESPLFYFGRLIEFSPFYILSFAALFLSIRQEKTIRTIAVLATLEILALFVLWGNYQSRYILAAIPFLILLGTNLCCELYKRVLRIDRFAPYLIGKTLLWILALITLLKAIAINMNLSFPNDFCYF